MHIPIAKSGSRGDTTGIRVKDHGVISIYDFSNFPTTKTLVFFCFSPNAHVRYNCRHRARRHTIHAPVPRAILAIVNQPIGPAMAVHKPARSEIVIATVNVYPPQNVDAVPDTMAMVPHVHGVPRARHRPGPPASLDAVSRPGQVDRIPQDRTGTHPSVVINHQH